MIMGTHHQRLNKREQIECIFLIILLIKFILNVKNGFELKYYNYLNYKIMIIKRIEMFCLNSSTLKNNLGKEDFPDT